MTSSHDHGNPDVLVIGAGPAGLAAANRAARAGLRVLLVDENSRVGGQISRLPFQYGAGTTISDLENLHPNVEFRNRTVCLGFVADRTVGLETGGVGSVVTASAVVVATGSVERVYPVPGWTKLGVMTAGAGQAFLKGSRTFPYQRVVVAGTGPLLLAAASQLVKDGVNVVGVIEAANLAPSQWKSFAKVTAGGSILLEGAEYVSRLVRARVPIMAGWAICAIDGEAAVTGVRVKKVDSDWKFRSNSQERIIECDAVLFSQGFTSVTDLVSQAGGEIVWNDLMQTWEPVRDDRYATTVPGIYAAGDCAGIGGSKIAALEGEAVGEAVAAALLTDGSVSTPSVRLRRALRRLGIFRRGMDEVFRVGEAVNTWPSPSTIVCRCQETTADDVACALRTGACTSQAVKLWTRAGMGVCQGRTCAHIIDSMLEWAPDRVSGKVARAAPRPRFPIRPTSVEVLSYLPQLVDISPSDTADSVGI
ncbi:MAG: NAD(P)/FAD-dependent oxidoreductase [Rhodoglobus sp.]